MFTKYSPYIVNPWNGITPLGGNAIVFSDEACLPLTGTCMKVVWLGRLFNISWSLEKHNKTYVQWTINSLGVITRVPLTKGVYWFR